ncbi:MAG: DUF952 domain-containing protein [Anaerolinea sp.]|nr:DUF952 domain-containing protein [Anaerolinea sp.]
MIYHITNPTAWKNGQEDGRYLPEGFEADGFIHCSKMNQIVGVGERYYAGQTGLLILGINPDKLTSRLVFENLIGGEELFPHIYGPLNLEAVESTADFGVKTDGSFEFPRTWVLTKQ